MVTEKKHQRTRRLEKKRLNRRRKLQQESDEMKCSRLAKRRKSNQGEETEFEDFYRTVNSFSEYSCEICQKQCYKSQVLNYRSTTIKEYLPLSLAFKDKILVCWRCYYHLKSSKNHAPSKAYWNNLLPGDIPEEIVVLTDPEKRLLQRIIPYVKVIKFPGRFGQYGFKGQATLFALGIFEVSEKLPDMLPRSSAQSGIIIITETLDNLNITKKYTISRERVYNALNWLIRNNPLYKDVKVNQFARLETQDVIRVIPANTEIPEELCDKRDKNEPTKTMAFKQINPLSRILRASWSQGDPGVFEPRNAGRQCFAMVVANCIRATILSPSEWNTNILNQNMIEGDGLYEMIVWKTSNQWDAFPIDGNGFLEIKNLDVVKNDIVMFDNVFKIEYDDFNGSFNGSLFDGDNDGINCIHLSTALNLLFAGNNYGILVVSGSAYGLIHCNSKFYFTDSHACGPKGKNGCMNGKACVIECDNTEEYIRIIRRTVLSKSGTQLSINAIDIDVKEGVVPMDQYMEFHTLTYNTADVSHESEKEAQHSFQYVAESLYESSPENNQQYIPVATSVMVAIDTEQPDIEDVFEGNTNINQIVRKTEDNIVKVHQEMKAEEFSWFYLFPYGRNGLGQERPVKITPLDYYQQRILGTDRRFQRTDYLFYALSMFEYYRVQSTINACGKTVKGQAGVFDDLHLYLKNLRGSGSYWRTAHNELIAFIRCLGPPTWFITLSCNDLNWTDMRKAFLIADGRPDEDPSLLSIDEVQHLIELYPVVLSRHFSRRVEAFMALIKRNDSLLGGKVMDYWTRIEFQNRGSPHVHLIVWIENAPSFESDAGLVYIDQVISCCLPNEEENPDLRELVKRNQVHRHTHTCHKNNSTTCRFAFPRKPSPQTYIVPPSSDEFIRNGGRFCTLKRREDEKWINNYNPKILKFWNANMDIQPCGSNESIAHYIAKYISKSEPSDVNGSVAQAIRQIRGDETNIGKKLFKCCMRVLKERQVSASECVYRLCHLPLRSSSRKCVFLNTRKPEQRYKVLKFQENKAVGLCCNIFDRYINRPREQCQGYDFVNMCLLEFAMYFEPFYAKKNADEEESIDAEHNEPPSNRKFIKLANNSKMIIRKLPAVVRTPFFQMTTDSENYFYSLLVQYTPFFSENELIDEHDDARDAFLSREMQLLQTSSLLEQHRVRDKQLEIAFTRAHAFNILKTQEELVEVEMQEEIAEQPDMTNEQFQSGCKALNLRQRELFNSITNSITDQMNGSSRCIRLFITGGAGVGKTFTFNVLKEQVNRCYGKKAVKVGALTGVAARLVGGTTLHSLLKLPVEKDGKIVGLPPLTGNFLKILRSQWKDVEFVFIDEISMVSYQLLCMIDSRIRQLKKREDEPFGGINIILFGDLFQLPPINGSQVFEQPISHLPAIHLWRLFTLIELTENMRQHGDVTFANLLNALRVGELKAPHFEILMSKLLHDATGDFDLDKAIRIYPTRNQVDAHNTEVIERYRSKGIRIFKICSQDVLVNATRNVDNVNIDNIISEDTNKTGGLPKILEIFVGARIMLRSNIDIQKGLINGAMGVITEIIWPLFRKDQMYDTDIPSVRVDFGKDGEHVIKPKSVQFPALRNYGNIERRQLPIIPCWACTVHKMQGCTVDYAVIYLGKKLFTDGQAYVALSRVRSLEGLKIEELDCTKLSGKTPCNEDALCEMQRMRNLKIVDSKK